MQTQELFGVEEMRQEAQELLGQSLLGWLSHGHAAFTKPPHWSFLINTLSCAFGFLVGGRGSISGIGVFQFSKLSQPHPDSRHSPTPTPQSINEFTHVHKTNTPTAAIATHRVQFLPLIAGTLGGLLAARFSEEESEEEAAMHA